jgi:UDP-sulfoquinovose synthase
LKILILGGDGFCGWPTSLHLSDRGHDIVIVDNLSRRKIDVNLGASSLTPIATPSRRIAAWKKHSGKTIRFVQLDLAREYDRLVALLKAERPEAVVHFAEQRSAPYSMKSPATKRYTVKNNTSTTHNLLAAITESGLDIHIVHLGTMGVYGYGWTGTAPIPEGYLKVKIDTPDGQIEREILHPANPGSVYHMTKTLDALMFGFYAKNDELRITDLHQGIVWGTQTAQTALDPALINRFDYDSDYGTVLNRFLMQSAIGHPLTVYGTGEQTRAFIHITDTVRCVEIALNNPPQKGDRPVIFNQVAETHRLIDLAKLISKLSGAELKFMDNPRVEAKTNELAVVNETFVSLGLKPTLLSQGLLTEITDIAQKYAARADRDLIPPVSKWRRKR